MFRASAYSDGKQDDWRGREIETEGLRNVVLQKNVIN